MTLATLTGSDLDVPAFVREWVAQLLAPETLALLRHGEGRQVDIRLAASHGKVRRQPVITFDGPAGPR